MSTLIMVGRNYSFHEGTSIIDFSDSKRTYSEDEYSRAYITADTDIYYGDILLKSRGGRVPSYCKNSFKDVVVTLRPHGVPYIEFDPSKLTPEFWLSLRFD